MIRISIIIPIYNGEEFLEECLNSVISQDIEEKEVICVDDGSTDKTVEIIKEYQKKYKNVKLLMQKNQGAASARNAALDVANGAYIAFMDADDIYVNSYGLRKMVETCELYGVPVCGSFYTHIRDGKMYPTEEWRNEFEKDATPKKFLYADYQQDFFYQNYVFERCFLNQHGLRFPNLRRYQDPPFFAKALWRAREFMIVPVEAYGYRLRPAQMKYSVIQIDDILKGIKQNIEFAIENKYWILYKKSIGLLNGSLYEQLKRHIANGNLTVLKHLLEVKEYIDTVKEIKDTECLRIFETMQCLFYESRFTGVDTYQFPYDKIVKDKKVVLYGAGVAGKEMAKKIQSVNYCTLVGWVDKNYEVLQKQGLNVENPQSMKSFQPDYIFVAVEKKEIYQEIKTELLKNGWSEDIIIGPIKRQGVF